MKFAVSSPSPSNPILIEAIRRATKRRHEREAADPVLFARRAGLEPDPCDRGAQRNV